MSRDSSQLAAGVFALAIRWHPRLLAVILVATFMVAAADCGFLYLLVYLLRRANLLRDTASLSVLVAAMFSLAFAIAFLRASAQRLQDRLAMNMTNVISNRIFASAMRQSYETHLNRDDAEITVALDDARTIGPAALLPLANVANHGIFVLALGGAILSLDWLLVASLAPVVVLTYWVIAKATQTRLRTMSFELSALRKVRTKLVHEAQSGFRDLLLSGDSSSVEAEFVQITDRIGRVTRQARYLESIPRTIAEPFVLSIGLAIIVVFLHTPGGITPSIPVLVALAAGTLRFLQSANGLFLAWGQFHANAGPLTSLLEITNRRVPDPTPLPEAALSFHSEIRLEGVCFRFANGTWALRDIDLVVQQGERIAILGPSGSGKSTLLDILLGLVEPEYGKVKVDDVTISGDAERLVRWRQSIGAVSQHAYLPDASIAQIIVGMQATYDRERLLDAITQAELTDWISTLPQGLMARVGDAGSLISGGQRQRIALARTLYRRARIIILDEATGQLDRSTEAAILDRLLALDRSHTIIFVTHHEAAVAKLDRVVRLREGRMEREESVIATVEDRRQ